jgi:beta-lactam-binding protein with PASTA domain
LFYKINRWLERHRTAVIGISVTLIVLIAWVLLMDWIVMPMYTHRGQENELPDVTEMQFDEAKALLESKGFRLVNDQTKHDDHYPAGTIIYQNPPPYSKVKKGRRIYVTVSSGETTVQMPKVLGISERDALFLLSQKGFSVGKIEYQFTDYYPAGVVCDQSIPEGTEAARKSTADITVSRGPLPDRFIVPNLVGLNVETAKKNLWQAGLSVGDVSSEFNRRLVPGTVIEQSLKAGSEASQGSAVNMVVSRAE